MANVPMLEWQKKLDITCGVGCVYSEELMLESKKKLHELWNKLANRNINKFNNFHMIKKISSFASLLLAFVMPFKV